MYPNLENPFRPADKRATKRLFKADELQKNTTTKATKEKINSKLENTLVKYGPHKILYSQVQYLKQLEKSIPQKSLDQIKETARQLIINGVKKVKQGNITELNLTYMKLGEIPEGISCLCYLSKFICGGNQLSELPADFFQLVNLQKLDISENKFEILPPEIGKLVNLRKFNCYSNSLKTLPVEIRKLKKLETFDCTENLLGKQEIVKIKELLPVDCKIINQPEEDLEDFEVDPPFDLL